MRIHAGERFESVADRGVHPAVENDAGRLSEIRAEDGYIVPTDLSTGLELLINIGPAQA